MIKSNGLYTKSKSSLAKENLSKPAELLRKALGSLKGPRDEMSLLIENGAAVKIPWTEKDNETITDYNLLAKNISSKLNNKAQNPETETSKEEDSPLMTEVVQLLSELTGRVVSLEVRIQGTQVSKSEYLEPEDDDIIQARIWNKGLFGEFKKYRKYPRRN